MSEFIINTLMATWHLLLDSSIYIILGLIFGGILQIFLSPQTIANHMGKGRFLSVFKAAVMGIPLPLCSCGVLPAAVSLKKQGANNGATTAFLISTPESGVDSISITYALLDPIMTVARPFAAFLMATVAGIIENLFNRPDKSGPVQVDLSCPVDQCCDGIDCPPAFHKNHHSFFEKIVSGFRYAFTDIWNDLVGWFFVGLLLAGIITAAVPDNFLQSALGGGLGSMVVMLFMGIPMYICATASTPVAAALIMKGVSPGAALVFLLTGPATNITSLTVLTGVLGKRTTAIYLSTIALFSIICGIMVNYIYQYLNISPQAIIGNASEIVPLWLQLLGTAFLLSISIKPLSRIIKARIARMRKAVHEKDEGSTGSGEQAPVVTSCSSSSCGCSHEVEHS